MPKIKLEELNEHLGDGVYASFDGYYIHLAVNDHRNLVVALEPEVQQRLVKYFNRIDEVIKNNSK